MNKQFWSKVLAVAMVFSMISSSGGFTHILTARATTVYSITINKSGDGTGTVTDNYNPKRINCGGTCSGSYAKYDDITLTATRGTNSIFAGWSGDCSGTGNCYIHDIHSNKTVTATFTIPSNNVCHTTGSGWNALHISGSDLASHLAHGDFMYEGPIYFHSGSWKPTSDGNQWCQDNAPECNQNSDCNDSTVCNGLETCNAAHQCVSGSPLQCQYGCDAINGCNLPPSICGDGVVNQTSEQCDDGNTQNGDGCSSTCQTELPDRDQDGVPDSSDNCPSVVNINQEDFDGDGVGDACDNCPNVSNTDQRDDDGDKIGNACDDYHCSPTGTGTEICTDRLDNDCNQLIDCDDSACANDSACQSIPPACGDGTVDSGEDCDDGNRVDVGDDCPNDCHFVVRYDCSSTGAGCVETQGGSFTTSNCDDQCGGTNLPIQIIASKVICAAEKYLPNWGIGGPDIYGNTAQTYVDESQQKCWLDDQWDFEWALGSVSNPGDNVETGGSGWNSFSVGQSAMISDIGTSDKIWVRETLPNDYTQFSGSTGAPYDDVSAEFYCHTDVLNYDNYDYIAGPQYGSTYHCVGFNALKQSCGNGVKEGTEECDGTEGVNPTANQDFCSTSCHLIPVYNSGVECPQGTKQEKVGDTYVINSSNIVETEVPVEEGKQYIFEVSGTFSPTSASGYLSDAGYTWVNDVLSTQYGIQGTPPDYAAHALLGDLGLGMGVVNWGANNSDHLYNFSYIIPVSTTTVKFVVGDRYGDWFTTDYQNQAGMGDNRGNLNLDVYKCVADVPPTESTVTICKSDVGERPLTDWNMILKGSSVETLTVYPYNEAKNNFALVTSSDLPTGDYIVEANGQYVYRPNTLGAEYSDAGYSKRLCPGDAPALCSGLYSPWANVTNFDPPYQGYLGLMVNEGSTDWGYFNSNHKYVLGYPNQTGALSFTIKDDTYSDNSGSLTADIYNGYAGVTGENGCVTFTGVPLGEYTLEEIMKDGWQNINGLGAVTVDEAQETFRVVNDIIRQGNITGHKYNDLDKDGEWDEGERGLGGWNICIDGNKDGDCNDAEDNPQTTTDGSNGGLYNFINLPVGEYQVCEVTSGHTGWASHNSPCQIVNVTEGQSVPADFFNYEEVVEEPKGSLTICKYRDYETFGEKGENDTPLAWDMTVVYPDQGGTLSTRTNGDSGCVLIENLPYGEYSVTENSQAGWTRTYPESTTQIITVGEQTAPAIFLNQYTPGPTPTYTGDDGTSGGTAGGGVSPTVAGVTTENTEPTGEVLGASTGNCDLYLYKYIKLGSNNDPVEVIKLQYFLNKYLGLNLPMDGIYSQDDFDAVTAFQLNYKDDVLQPWVDVGLLASSNDPTGYVYRTTQRKINLIVCPELGLAIPDLTDEIGKFNSYGEEGSVLGASTEATTTSTTVTTVTTKSDEGTVLGALDETGKKNINWFLIFLGLIVIGGGLYAVVLRKRK